MGQNYFTKNYHKRIYQYIKFPIQLKHIYKA